MAELEAQLAASLARAEATERGVQAHLAGFIAAKKAALAAVRGEGDDLRAEVQRLRGELALNDAEVKRVETAALRTKMEVRGEGEGGAEDG